MVPSRQALEEGTGGWDWLVHAIQVKTHIMRYAVVTTVPTSCVLVAHLAQLPWLYRHPHSVCLWHQKEPFLPSEKREHLKFEACRLGSHCWKFTYRPVMSFPPAHNRASPQLGIYASRTFSRVPGFCIFPLKNWYNIKMDITETVAQFEKRWNIFSPIT